MKRQSTGRGTAVLNSEFTTALRGIVESTHTATCAIRHPGAGTSGAINTTTGVKTVTPKAPHFTGSCSVSPRASQSGADLQIPDQTLPTYDFIVSLAHDAAPDVQSKDIVTVTKAGVHGAADITVSLQLEFIDHDSVTAEKILMCVEYQG